MEAARPKGRVLVVEPSSAAGGQSQSLREAGFETTSAPTEAAVLEATRQGGFDVLLVDLETPRVDATSLWRRIQSEGSRCTSVFLARRWTNELSVHCAEEGVFRLLQKPADPETVSRLVSAAVAENRQVSVFIQSLIGRHSQTPCFAAKDAKNEFGSLLETASREGAVIITKREAPKAVLLSYERLMASVRRPKPDLQALGKEFDALVARMRTPAGKAAARRLFTATPEEMGQAAVAAVKKANG